jgi:RNA polymerase sigma factor (sigma-70 family)
MYKRDEDIDIEVLSYGELRKCLDCDDWKNEANYIKDETVFRMFRQARSSGNEKQVGLLSNALSRRILARAYGFVLRSRIHPTFIDDLDSAAYELASVVWERLLTSESDATRAEQAFGQIFKRRALDFQRKFYSKKRANQDSLDALDQVDDGEDAEIAELVISSLHDDHQPEDFLAQKQTFQQLRSAMFAVLTPDEFATLEMIYDLEMPVKDVAKALNKTSRSINNYERRALAKLQKELSQ